jgi:hypothetical protein
MDSIKKVGSHEDTDTEIVKSTEPRAFPIRLRLEERVLKEKALAAVKTQPPPRYDDVFYQGVAWLDSL